MSVQFWDWLYNVTDKAVTWFNIFEAFFWITVGAGFLWMILRHACKSVKVWTLATILLMLFGVSDFFEAQSGAWWRPWWLLTWKGLCLFALIALYAWHRRGAPKAAECAVKPDLAAHP
jgi:hypothetical protein